MSKGYFSGFAWHVEKAKGTNTTWKKCKNCIFFENDDNSCIKKLIPITNNNAKYCKDYVNIHDENTSSYLAEIKNERKNLIGKKH